MVAEGADGVDGDADAGGFAGEKLRRDAEEELVVPGRVFAADFIDSGSELGIGVDPCESVGLESPPWRCWWLQALCGDQVDLQNLLRRRRRLRRRRHCSLSLLNPNEITPFSLFLSFFNLRQNQRLRWSKKESTVMIPAG